MVTGSHQGHVMRGLFRLTAPVSCDPNHVTRESRLGNSLPWKEMEAGTGIEPVFTDLQSRQFTSPIKNLGGFSYQDKASTGREPDTPQNEGPAASGKANGANKTGQVFKSEAYRKRAEAATTLCYAIAACEPEDAAPILEAALLSMSAGWPVVPLLGLMDAAGFWADLATGAELKAYALACYTRMPAADRAAFLAYVGGGNG